MRLQLQSISAWTRNRRRGRAPSARTRPAGCRRPGGGRRRAGRALRRDRWRGPGIAAVAPASAARVASAGAASRSPSSCSATRGGRSSTSSKRTLSPGRAGRSSTGRPAMTRGQTKPPRTGRPGPRMIGMSPVKSRAPIGVGVVVDVRGMQAGLAAVGPRPVRLGPDQAHAGAAGVVVHLPRRAVESMAMSSSVKKSGAPCGPSSTRDAPRLGQLRSQRGGGRRRARLRRRAGVGRGAARRPRAARGRRGRRSRRA